MQRLLLFCVISVSGAVSLHAQWIQQKSGTTTELTDVVAIDSVRAIAVGRDGSILRTTDTGQTWVILPLAPLFFHPWNAASFSSQLCGGVVGDFGRIAVTTDGGDQWT